MHEAPGLIAADVRPSVATRCTRAAHTLVAVPVAGHVSKRFIRQLVRHDPSCRLPSPPPASGQVINEQGDERECGFVGLYCTAVHERKPLDAARRRRRRRKARVRVYNDHAGAGGTSGRGRTRRVMGLPFTERGGSALIWWWIGWDNTVLRTYIAVIGASLGRRTRCRGERSRCFPRSSFTPPPTPPRWPRRHHRLDPGLARPLSES